MTHSDAATHHCNTGRSQTDLCHQSGPGLGCCHGWAIATRARTTRTDTTAPLTTNNQKSIRGRKMGHQAAHAITKASPGARIPNTPEDMPTKRAPTEIPESARMKSTGPASQRHTSRLPLSIVAPIRSKRSYDQMAYTRQPTSAPPHQATKQGTQSTSPSMTFAIKQAAAAVVQAPRTHCRYRCQ